MSIASEITSMGENLKKDYQSIANLGADLTNVDKNIENIAELLDGVYDVLPKTSFQEGTDVTIEGGLKGKIDFDDGKVGFGQASQESTQGYNLLNTSNLTPSTINGITFTPVYKDGMLQYILVNGTASETTALDFGYKIYESGTYTLSGCPANGSDTTYCSSLTIQGGSWAQQREYGSGAQVTTNGTSTYFYRIRIYTGYTCNNLKFYPMIVSGTTAKTYEPYTGGYASPSPNWEQEVKCVAGRNIWGGIGTFNNANLAKTNADGTIDINITNLSITSAVTSQAVSYELTKVLKRGTYTFTAENLISTMFCQIIKVNSATSGEVFKTISTVTTSLTFTITEDMTYFIRVQAEEGTTFNGTIKPMICEGTAQRPYLPYNTIEETISGKNLCSGVTTGGYNNTTGQAEENSALYRNSEPIPVKPNTKYIFSINGTAYNINKYYYDRNMNYISHEENVYPLISAPDNAYYLNIYKGTTGGNEKWQVVEGTEGNTYTLTYEPYVTPRTYQFSLGNNKFYNIGTYRDYILRTTGKNKFGGTLYNGQVGSNGGYSSSTNRITNISGENEIGTTKLSKGTYTISIAGLDYCTLLTKNSSGTILDNFANEWQSLPFTFTLTQEGYVSFTARKSDNSNINTSYNVMLQQGSTASDYQPYGVGNWYKVGTIIEKIVTGSYLDNLYTFMLQSINSYGIANFLLQNANWDIYQRDYGLCNYFTPQVTTIANTQTEGIMFASQPQGEYIRIKSTSVSTTQEFKDYVDELNANGSPLKIYRALMSPTYTPITGDLATQLEAFWNGQSLDGTTIIEGDGDLPMIIKVRALKGE